jgi:transcriptional regulator with XRE-family HTH domain
VKLSTLLRLLGLTELARRAGVAPSTIRRWERHGPSLRGQDVLAGIAARRRRSVKGAKTRKRKEREAFRDRLPVPVSPDLKPHRPGLGQFDDPSVLVPDQPPIETEEELRRKARRGGHDIEGEIDTETWAGETYWVTVEQPALEIDFQWVLDTVQDFQQQAARRWVQVVFMFFRFVPFNPLYKGDEIERFQGKWKQFWLSTEIVETEYELSEGILKCISEAHFAAENRMIWLQGYKVRTMNMKPDAPTDWRNREIRRERSRA